MKRLLQGLFWVCAIGYIATMHLGAFPGHWLVKAIPALSLAVLVKIELDGRLSLLLAAALVLSAGGDIALSIRDNGVQTYFVVGLGLFLLAHVCYIAAFALDRCYQPARLPLMIGVGLLAGGMMVVLVPHLGDMLIPVWVYIVVITMMTLAAAMNTRGGFLLVVGAVVFMISDATIAVNVFLFSEPHPVASYFIMLTYYAAQYAIATAFVQQRE